MFSKIYIPVCDEGITSHTGEQQQEHKQQINSYYTEELLGWNMRPEKAEQCKGKKYVPRELSLETWIRNQYNFNTVWKAVNKWF